MKDMIANLRGGIPVACNFCRQEKPPEQMEPEEAGEWVCWACLDRWEYQEHGGHADMSNRIRILDWQRITSDGEETARVRCPKCQTWGTLDHVIAPDGRVAPSVACATEGCDFHEMIWLAGWQRREIGPA